MKVTADIIRHEFVGTEAKITRSTHHGNVGLRGKVTDETRNTFTIVSDGKRNVVPKDSNIFQFKFADDTIVEIEGKMLLGKPEDRLKKNIRRLW